MKFLFIFLFAILSVFPQSYEYKSSIGKFRNAVSFHINSAGFIYVTDAAANTIIKLDTLGNVLKDNGGFGWDEASFDYPSGVYSTTLNVYVSDRNNHRVQYFDKDLNYLSSLRTRGSDNNEITFGYPADISINRQGDLFIIDSENKRIIKFDMFGNFILNFGGYNYGRYSLKDPLKIATGPANNIYVADKDRLVVFDQYGNGAAELQTGKNITDINIIFNQLTLISDGKIVSAVLGTPELIFNEINLGDYTTPQEIKGSFIFNNKLYVLTPKQIDVFGKVK